MAKKLKGLWQLNEALDTTQNFIIPINFTSNNIVYTSFQQENNILWYDSQMVYADNIWNQDNYRIIDFGQEEQEINSDIFYNWLITNAKQITTTLAYKNKILAYLPKGKQVTLHTKDQELEDDINIKAYNREIISHEIIINENGVYTPDDGYDGLSKVTVDIPSIPIEINDEAEMTALTETAPVGSVFKYTGTSDTYENGALYIVEERE